MALALTRTRTRMHAREKSLKNFGLVPLRCRHVQRCRALAALSCRSCRGRGWSGWGGIEQRDDIVDLGVYVVRTFRTFGLTF